MTKVVIRGGLAWRREGDALVTLTPGEAAAEIERLNAVNELLALEVVRWEREADQLRARSLEEGANTAGRQRPSKSRDAGSNPAGHAKHEYVDCPKGTGCPDCYGWAPDLRVIDDIDERFQSGNSIAVERAYVKASEWIAIKAALSQYSAHEPTEKS